MKITKPYTCPRCEYNTTLKANMRKHLYRRGNVCPAFSKDIELTDKVKEYILVNRLYKEDTNSNKNHSITTREKDDKYHYIYLIRCKENVRHNENIYKVGKTVEKEITTTFKRFGSYGKGTEILLLRQCIDSTITEKKILEELNKSEIFTKYELGREYFIGNCNDMIDIIHNIISKDYKEISK